MTKNYIFYDLETNGLDYYTTGIMQISMIDNNGDVLLNQYTYPYDNRIEGSNIHGIDEQKLIINSAVDTLDMFLIMKKIIREKYGREDIYLVGYNNFGYDQIILENNFKISGIKIPDNWNFIDLFPVIKELYPNMKPNYKLKTVYEILCGSDETINFHCALADTTCLYNIFNVIKDKTNYYEIYNRPLLQSKKIFDSPIFTISGYNKSIRLEDKGIRVIGDLYNIFKDTNFNTESLETILRNKYNIYSDFYLNNIIKSISVIYYFHK
jgi:DNA polymerase III epsilon subunit-like protein